IVRRARAKIIEPCFGEISHFDRTLPEWCGHHPGARPERFGALIDQHEAWLRGERAATPFRTIAEVAGLYSAFLEADLNERPHQGEGMNKVTPSGRGWMSPNEAWELLIPRVERRAVPVDTLQFAFARRKDITVQHGEVRTTIDGAIYHYRLVGHPIGLMAYNGRTVRLAYDPLDPSSGVLYTDRDELIGLVFAAPLRRMGADDGFVQDERDRRFARREVKKCIAELQRAVPVATPEERLARRLAVQPARVEPERPLIEAPVAPAIADAVEAARGEREFSFANSAATVESRPVESSEDDEFCFF
ncbi:MAG: hypothetical protein HY873_02635, partial [Chloroflexi bacterium]|nr:hypothetical protein [Chloroflexota bacterium]